MVGCRVPMWAFWFVVGVVFGALLTLVLAVFTVKAYRPHMRYACATSMEVRNAQSQAQGASVMDADAVARARSILARDTTIFGG